MFNEAAIDPFGRVLLGPAKSGFVAKNLRGSKLHHAMAHSGPENRNVSLMLRYDVCHLRLTFVPVTAKIRDFRKISRKFLRKQPVI